MNTYQPKEKSFELYIEKGCEYASGKKLSGKELQLLEKVSDIDTSIIKIDDVLDNEETRNDSKTIHLIDGIEKTIINAKLDEISGVESLTKLIDFRKVFPRFSYEILKVFNNKYMKNIYEGQKIDKELEESDEITEETLNKYFEMVEKFTGGHIRYGLEIGQLLAGKIPDKNVSEIGELLGVNRQIIDDFQDYFKAHHNPGGDLKRGAKRIPEILFTINGGDRDKVVDLVNNKKYDEVIKEVLNKDLRSKLYNYCSENLKKCEDMGTDFDYQSISSDPSEILARSN